MKYILNILVIILLVFAVRGVIEFKKSSEYRSIKSKVNRSLDPIKEYVEVKKHNINIENNPGRKSPVTSIEKEERLKMLLPDVFGEFSRKDWKNFWSFIYKPVANKEEGISKKQFRSKEEIKSYLLSQYPSFSRFQSDHWNYFWEIVLEK